MKKQKQFYIQIPVDIYRLHVIVAWGASKDQIMALAKESNVQVTENGFGATFAGLYAGSSSGFCMEFGENGNTDVLVYLRRRPRKTTEYGTLYHELFHTVQSIIKDHDLHAETESPAYLYEYLATECNKYFWRLK